MVSDSFVDSPTNFSAFLTLLVDGDEKSWQRFIDEFHPLISSVCTRASLEHTDDIVQEIYLAVVKDHFKLLRRFEGASRAAFLVYMKRIAENTARNFVKKHRRRHAELGEALNDLADERETPEAALLKETDLERLTAAIALLREDYQNVMHLLMKGYRHREVAEMLDIPLKTSLTWANRAMGEIRKALKIEITPRGEHILS